MMVYNFAWNTLTIAWNCIVVVSCLSPHIILVIVQTDGGQCWACNCLLVSHTAKVASNGFHTQIGSQEQGNVCLFARVNLPENAAFFYGQLTDYNVAAIYVK
jgi:hypothetical protein